jgi:membrane-associated phospholipid phosphatase
MASQVDTRIKAGRFTKWALGFVAMILVTIALAGLDAPVQDAIRRSISDDAHRIIKPLSNYGVYPFYLAFALLLVYSLVKPNKRIRHIVLLYIQVQLLVSFAVVRVLKIVIGRARPPNGDEFHFFSLRGRYNSFPSGHATDAMVSGLFLFYLLKGSIYRFVPLLYALLVAGSRVVIGVHYVTDVVFGTMLGAWGAYFFLSRQPELGNDDWRMAIDD